VIGFWFTRNLPADRLETELEPVGASA
jgi:hypothetical protein